MFGFDLRSPQRLATSSGSVSLNSPFVPSHVMAAVYVCRTKHEIHVRIKRENRRNTNNYPNLLHFVFANNYYNNETKNGTTTTSILIFGRKVTSFMSFDFVRVNILSKRIEQFGSTEIKV